MMKRTVTAGIIGLAALISVSTASMVAAAAAPGTDGDLQRRARRLLREVPLIDGHNDTPWQYRKRVSLRINDLDFGADLSELEPPMHTDLARLREGGVGAQFWSVFIPIPQRGGRPGDARTVIEQIDFVKRLVDRYPDDLELALTADDIERIHRAGRIASLIGMEGGHSIEDSLAVLRATYELGARYMTIAHVKNTRWADSATDDAEFDGLADFGREVIALMNDLGMMIDLSHASADTMRQTIEASRAPVACTHSGAAAILDYPRNVPDDVLRLVAEMDGSISAEHGVGVAKTPWLGLTRDDVDVSMMRALKRALDPDWLMNPGVIFEDES